MPQTLTISNPLGSATNSYTYAADGRKLKTVIGGKTTDYCGNVIYENGVLKRILVEGGYIEGGTYYFYLTDHLGNNRVVANASGAVVQTNHYYPFGMSFPEGAVSSSQPYKYNGKELDTDRGLNLYDYSARYMDPTLGRFNTVDPMAEKYYSISPYAYCAGNSVRFFDPNGKEIWIYYDDEDGKRQQMLYNANMKYEDDNTFVSASVNYLNSMYSNGGADIMDVLIGSNNSFNMINKTPTDNNGNTLDALQFNETAGGGGDIYAGMLMNSSYSDYVKVEGFSHELFHGFQYEKGQGGASVFNEVEAMVYSSVIANNWLSNNPDYIGALSSNGLGNGSASGNLYEQSFKSLVKDGYSKELFVNTIKTFKTGSNSNASGGYTKIPLMRNNTQVPLLKKYNPKLRK